MNGEGLNNIREEIIHELHKPIRKNFKRRHVVAFNIDDLWQADLVEMDSGNLKGISKINKGYKYLLTIIDVFSKFAWAIPVKDKTGKNIVDAFEKIFRNGRNSKNLQTDNGKEFYNKDFQELMKKYNINHYSTFTELKASVVERFNRTLKEKMWKKFDLQGNYRWVDLVSKLVGEYNNTVHRTIKKKPIEVNEKNYKIGTIVSNDKAKFKKGDKVRISKLKGLFEKGYTANWSTEIFEIEDVIHSNPITYKLRDLNGEEVKGNFYEQELQKTKFPDVYLVERVLRKKGDKVFVKWLGFDNSHNSWLNKDKIIL